MKEQPTTSENQPPPPPRFVAVPVELLYQAPISAGALRTYLRILGLHWDQKMPPRLTHSAWVAACGVSRSTFYRHIDELGLSGWLLSGQDEQGVLSFIFPIAESIKGDANPKNGNPERQTLTITPSLASQNRDAVPKIGTNDGASRPGNTPGASQNRDNCPKNGNAAIKLNTLSLLNHNQEVNASVPKTGRRKKDTKTRDPLLKHPAVILYRDYMHLTPNHTQRPAIAAAAADLELWQDTLQHWAGHGWRPTNVTGMLDSYHKGGKAACRLCSRTASKAAPKPAAPKLAAPSPQELRQMIEKARQEQQSIQKGDNP